MMSKRVIVKIRPNGEVEEEVQGASGSGCTDITRPFEEALGGTVERELKAEYHDNAQVDEDVNVGGGA